MRIIINDISASRSGAMSILKQFYTFVLENDCENEWIFLLRDNFFEESDNVKIMPMPQIGMSRRKKLMFMLFGGRKLINSLNPDIVVSLQNILTFGVKAPQVLYIHQALPYQRIKSFSFLKKDERSSAVYQYIIGFFIHLSARKADAIIAQSSWMKNAIITQDRLDEKKVISILPDYEMAKADIHIFKNNLFFYPTNTMCYKNNNLIVEACNKLNRGGFTDFNIILTVPDGSVRHPNITCVGEMKKEEVLDSYCKTTLLFPSYVETLGLPLMEARSAGTVVLASDMPFSHELLDGYVNCRFFDPFNADELAAHMKEVLSGALVPAKSHVDRTQISRWSKVYDYILNTPTKRKGGKS